MSLFFCRLARPGRRANKKGETTMMIETIQIIDPGASVARQMPCISLPKGPALLNLSVPGLRPAAD